MSIENHVCLVCNTHFSEPTLLKFHLKKHMQKSEKYEDSYYETSDPYDYSDPREICEVVTDSDCQFSTFSDDGSYDDKMTVIKTSTKFKEAHTCSTCGREFRRKDHLDKHYMVHSGVKPFSCLICGKTFARKDRLKEHNVVHLCNGWSCYFCGKMFSQRYILRKHEMIHRGVKPFLCDVCDMKFSRKNDLLRHQTSHTGIKSYFCEVCGKGFAQKRLLKRHWKVHKRAQRD